MQMESAHLRFRRGFFDKTERHTTTVAPVRATVLKRSAAPVYLLIIRRGASNKRAPLLLACAYLRGEIDSARRKKVIKALTLHHVLSYERYMSRLGTPRWKILSGSRPAAEFFTSSTAIAFEYFTCSFTRANKRHSWEGMHLGERTHFSRNCTCGFDDVSVSYHRHFCFYHVLIIFK